MNRKLISYRKQLEDEIIENNHKAYEYEKAMESHQQKAKDAKEILDLLDKGKRYGKFKSVKDGINEFPN